MAEHRERVDRRMSQEDGQAGTDPAGPGPGSALHRQAVPRRATDDEDKTIKWGIGHKRHGDRRHRTSATFTGIVYRDGETHRGRRRVQYRG